MSASAIFIIAVLFVVMALIFFARYLLGRIELLKTMNETLERQKAVFAAELARCRTAQEVVNDNRRRSDSEVDDLHSGDALGNAIDKLRER